MDKPIILVVNPNTSQEMTAAIDRMAQAAAGPSASVVTTRSNNGPYTIEGALDAALAALNRGNSGAAINILSAFERQVRTQIAPLDPRLAETLVAAAKEIFDKLAMP